VCLVHSDCCDSAVLSLCSMWLISTSAAVDVTDILEPDTSFALCLFLVEWHVVCAKEITVGLVELVWPSVL